MDILHGGISRYTRGCVILACTMLSFAMTSQAVVNVYPSDPALQGDFLANTTNQWFGTLSSSFFGTPVFTLTGKNPNYPPALICPPPTVCPPDSGCNVRDDLAIATATLAGLTTDYYLYGWSNGVSYERIQNVNYLSAAYLQCDNTNYFATPVNIDSCRTVLSKMANDIYTLFYSTPTPVPGF